MKRAVAFCSCYTKAPENTNEPLCIIIITTTIIVDTTTNTTADPFAATDAVPSYFVLVVFRAVEFLDSFYVYVYGSVHR